MHVTRYSLEKDSSWMACSEVVLLVDGIEGRKAFEAKSSCRARVAASNSRRVDIGSMVTMVLLSENWNQLLVVWFDV